MAHQQDANKGCQHESSAMTNNCPLLRATTVAPTKNPSDKGTGAMVITVAEQSGQEALAESQAPVHSLVRVGEKVSFSTVVEAVLIPSITDIDAESKREIW